MAFAPWEVLGGERFRTKVQRRDQMDERMDIYPGWKERLERVGKVLARRRGGEGDFTDGGGVALCVEETGLCFPAHLGEEDGAFEGES
jgi:hypothetical protein